MRFIFEMIRIMWLSVKSGVQLAYGSYKLLQLAQPIVAIFGGKGAYESGKYARWAEEVGQRCVEQNMSVITGGGPGIMEAANCGAYKASRDKKRWTRWTLGIGVSGVDVDFHNPCAPMVTVDYFFVRKWLLTRYACGFILFPGGIGTMDEFFEVLNLTKLGKMRRVPIVLVGSSYWKDLIGWYKHAFESEFITLAPQNSFVVTDDLEQAVKIIAAFCQK